MIAPIFLPYRYRKPRQIPADAPTRLRPTAGDEGLTGFVQGKEASDLEERFARALSTYGLDYTFKFYVETSYTLPYQEKQVDFVVQRGQPEPWEVDGEFTHKSAEQQEYDQARDAQVNEALMPYGYRPVQRVTEEYLGTQDGADLFVGEFIA